jgi:ribosomal protein S18 acetylase RimI-like enzyme
MTVGRSFVEGPHDLPRPHEFDEFDITFLRTPADNWSLASCVAQLPTHVGFIADHLCFWDWRSHRGFVALDAPSGWSVDDNPPLDTVVSVVRSAFDGYVNHYAANPLLADVPIVDAYAEWSTMLLERPDGSSVVVSSERGEPVAVAVVDWSGERPDIRLAGVHHAHQRQGLYSILMQRVMLIARERGADGVEISTQSHNTAVMRAWARLGFEPRRTLATVHVVRRSILSAADMGTGRWRPND